MEVTVMTAEINSCWFARVEMTMVRFEVAKTEGK
jgi:hypothetical protein